MTGELVGNPRAGGRQLDQLLQRLRVFHQQGDIGGATCHRLDEGQQARTGFRALLLVGHRGEQQRHQAIQALTTNRLHLGNNPAFTQRIQLRDDILCLGDTTLGQLRRRALGIEAPKPHFQQGHIQVLALAWHTFRLRHHLVEVQAHTLAMFIQRLLERLDRQEAHAPGQPLPTERIARQLLRLPVTNGLQPMLDIAQEHIALRQLGGHRFLKQPLRRHARQHGKQVRLAQGLVLAATNQLEHLHGKLDLANPAAAELDVVLHALAIDFALDQQLHLAQRFKHAVINITAIDKRRQALPQARAGIEITGHRAHLDQRIALPFAPLRFVIAFHGIKADRQRATLAPRAQAHVDTKHEAIDGHRIQRLDQ